MTGQKSNVADASKCVCLWEMVKYSIYPFKKPWENVLYVKRRFSPHSRLGKEIDNTIALIFMGTNTTIPYLPSTRIAYISGIVSYCLNIVLSHGNACIRFNIPITYSFVCHMCNITRPNHYFCIHPRMFTRWLRSCIR